MIGSVVSVHGTLGVFQSYVNCVSMSEIQKQS